MSGPENGNIYRLASTPNLKQEAPVPGAGHWVQREHPEEANLLLIGFLNELFRDEPSWPKEDP